MEDNRWKFFHENSKRSNGAAKTNLCLLLVCVVCIHLSGCGTKNAKKTVASKAEIEGVWRVDVCVRVDNSDVDKSIERSYKFVVIPGKYGGYSIEDVGHSFIDVCVSPVDGSDIQFNGFQLCDNVGPVYQSDTGWFFSVGSVEVGEEEREVLFVIYAPRSARGRLIVAYVMECQRYHREAEGVSR